MEFQEFLEDNFKYREMLVTCTVDDLERTYKAGWLACKEEVLKELEEYHHVPAYPHIKNSIENIV